MSTALTYARAHQAAAANGHVWTEPNPRRIRVLLGDEVVADTRRSLYLFEQGKTPVYYLPREDVRFDLLEPTATTTHCPWKGDASYWSVVVGDRVATDAVWGYPSPLPDALDLSGYVAFYWDRVDAWFEEDEEVLGPRDPYKRVDVVPSSRHVVVRAGDVVVAETTRPSIVFETGLPPRYYVPRADVRPGVLAPSDTRTRCPYKGWASHWHLHHADVKVDDAAWSYPTAVPSLPGLAGLVSFYVDKVTVEVDGEVQGR